MTEPVYYEEVKHSDIIKLMLAASKDEGEASLLVRFGGRNFLIAVRLAREPEATPDQEPEEAADTPEPLRMDDMVKRLAALGIPSFIEGSGGNVATLYAGEPIYPGKRYPAIAGPGWFEHHGIDAPPVALASAEDFMVDHDYDVASAPTHCTTVDEAVAAIQARVAQGLAR